jgi:hypothetical protein
MQLGEDRPQVLLDLAQPRALNVTVTSWPRLGFTETEQSGVGDSHRITSAGGLGRCWFTWPTQIRC